MNHDSDVMVILGFNMQRKFIFSQKTKQNWQKKEENKCFINWSITKW